ncbi:MAG: Fic family protein [Bacilli bacterium]|nr:Fic family protein [Bacilli bacterium]
MTGRREVLPLKTDTGRLFTINREYLSDLVRELETFLDGEDFMNNRTFSKKVLFTHEIKANNTVEGINDSVSLIEKVIANAHQVSDVERRNRIINLYEGYRYILQGNDITEENVHKLYELLSKDLLSREDRDRMGTMYRTAPVYILQGGRLDDTMDHGIDESKVPDFMKVFFDYVNNGETFNSPTDYFIKSQIMHFYFVYIHPYFDINGRTSRTVAMWYLLNNDIFPYIIFNRGINFDSTYDRTIRECKDRYEITKFLKYMLINVKKELEKEYVMHHLRVASGERWKTLDYQTMEYILSMNGNMTVLDFAALYNRFNDKKKVKEIFETMLLPMIENGSLVVERETNKDMFQGERNLVLSLNKKRIDEMDTSKITRIGI